MEQWVKRPLVPYLTALLFKLLNAVRISLQSAGIFGRCGRTDFIDSGVQRINFIANQYIRRGLVIASLIGFNQRSRFPPVRTAHLRYFITAVYDV